MMLRKKTHYFQPPNLSPGGTTLLGSVVKNAIDTSFPLEEILLFVTVVVNTQLTLTGVDNILGIVKKINLSVNDNNQPRNIVDCRGIMLLDYVEKAGLSLDPDTLGAIQLCQGASTLAASMALRLCYRIPLVHPAIGEPLRTRCLMPLHTWNQQPILTVEFEQGANMFSAGALSFVQAEYTLLRRAMPDTLTAAIIKDGGFIGMDLLETIYPVPTGTQGELRFDLVTPGSLLNLLLVQYLGGSSVTRNVIDQSGTGATVALNIGNESKWRLESGGIVEHEWRWKHLRAMNGFSMPKNNVTQSSSPALGGVVASNTQFLPASSVMLDFLDDGVPADGVNELGSVLDLNIPPRSGLKMQLIGSVASVATNASTIYALGHRLYGDLSPWQTVKAR